MLLIVDNDPQFLEEAEQRLQSPKGIFFARNAIHAKELMGSVGGAFTAVLVDLDLPGQDGFSLIREMHLSFPGLPLIAISGVFQPDVLESAKLVGAADTLPKPITAQWNDVIARVRARAGTSLS
jgi:DNA-binding NtrC family response regulator